ncbi:nucleoprotein TPR-like isoform X2 [Macrobrachium nipponense]|uniref:nucleoprotein TPR-like isoform X2 n=1 Tax=Macrobrachium nipponense TaxID=159736 RepID=UPI0030C7F1C8
MAETQESDGEEIFSIFSKDEKEGLSEVVRRKLEDVWSSRTKEIRCLKVEIDKIKINSDQERFNLEKELVTLRGQLEEEVALKEEAASARESNESRIIKLEDELGDYKTKVISLTRELQQSQNEQENVSSQSAAMAGSLETRTRRIQELQEQVNVLEEQLTQALRSKCDAMLKSEEAASKELKAQYKEKRLEQEKSLLSRQVDVLQQQIRERAEENLDQRREHSSTILNLQATLNRNIEELRVVKEEKEMCQKQIDEKNKRIEELLTALNSSRESETKLDEMYRQELAAQKKLAEIYQGSAEDEKERCVELEKALEEHRQLLQSASEQYGLLERTKEKLEEEHAVARRQSEALVKELKEELDKANVLLSASAKKDSSGLEELSPAASAASNLISRGLSLTQLYSEYMNVSEKLHAVEEENKRLHRYVDGIVEEIEERVPVFKKHREEHQKALETINSLHAQLESCLSQTEKQKLDLDESVRRRSYLERENDRLNQQAKDLSKQVTVLVTQVEAARAGLPPPPIPREMSGPTSADVISDRLVAFRNVSELQEQNKMLRESLRKLSEDMETSEAATISSRTKEMEEELKSLKGQLNELQALRERQESLMDNIAKQRDMYKSFCSERSPKTRTPPVKQPPQMFGVPQEEVQKLQKELEAARKKLEETNKEHDDYRMEVKKNEKMQQDEYNRLRSTMEKTMSENVKLLSQAEFNDERLKVLQHNSEVLQRQLGALQNNNSTLHGIVGRHEGTIEAQRREFMLLQKEHSRMQVMCDNMREEMKLLKEAEARLLAERESITRNQSSQAIVLANIESIKNNLERNDSEKTMRLENQVSELTERCSRLQAKLETNTDFKEAQSKLNIAEGQLKNLQSENKNLTKQVMDAKAEIMTLKSRLKETQERVRTPITSPVLRPRSPLIGSSPGASGGSTIRLGGPQLRDLQVQLNEEKAKVTSLQGNLDDAKKTISELMNVTKQQEKQLKDSGDSFKVTQEQFIKMQKERDEMEAMITRLQSKLSAISSDSENTKARLQTMLDESKDELQASEKRLKDANESFQKAKEEEERARKEAQKLHEQSVEVQNKYEREVMLHGTDLKTLAELKKRQAEFDSELQKVTAAKIKAEEAVRDTRLGFEKRENILRRENKDLMVRAHELEEQNKALLDNFTQLSDKMAAIQAKLSSTELPAGDAANISISEDEARTSDQLREVIKYLRRERDVAAGKYEVAEAETQRLVAQKKLMETQIQDVQKNLAEEREKNKASLESASNYGELMRKVLTVDALADSNRLLREEKESLESLYEEYKAKCEVLEKQIEPINERHKSSLNKIEALMLEKKSMESEKDLYKKRTQELVEKLNHAKPEDFMKLQQNFAEQQKSLQAKENELSKLKLQLQQVQKSLQMTIAQKNQFNSQLQSSREEARKLGEEVRKTAMEKARIQQQLADETKKLNLERTRLQQQLAQTQERVRILEASAQQSEANHQQEMRKLQEQFTQDKQQLQENREQALESKGREDQLRHQLEIARKEKEEIESQVEDAKQKIAEISAKAENFEKQAVQLRKIATKYKRQAESSMSASPGAPDMGEEGMVQPTVEKVKELEVSIHSLRQKQESTEEECLKFQQEITTLKENLSTKESEGQNLKAQLLRKDAEFSKLRAELEAKKRELQSSQMLSLHISDLTKRLEESQSKKQASESRLIQYEKERDQNAKEVEMLNKKLQMQQRQIENLQKQAAVTSKPSTSGVSSEKSGFEPPPTANIKPMNAPVAPSASPRSQTATQVVPPSRPIPTASIRPMAPPSGGSAQPQGSTVVVVSPLETHSDGMVSSTVTLPQATVTPTPAISAPTLLTTATTTPASTLTATVSPTPASASLTTPVAPATPLSSNTAAQSSQSLTATQSTSVSQSSVSQSAAALEASSASQSSTVSQPGSSIKPPGLQTTVAPSSSVAVQSPVSSKATSAQQPATASTSVVTPLVSAATGVSGSSMTPTKSPGTTPLSRQQETLEGTADALVSQAIALVTPLSSQEAAGPSGVSIRKRKLTSTTEASPDMKRPHVDDEGAMSSEDAGPSSSHASRDKSEEARHDVILLDSDEEDGNEDYPDQGDDEEDDDGPVDHESRGPAARVTDSDEDMDHDDSSREASQGFEAGQETREAEGDLGNAEAEAEAASEASSGTRREVESQDVQSERPQPSAGPSQPSSSSQGSETPSQTGSRVLAIPRPFVRQDRMSAVGRQTLPPISQFSQYEEGGDDSIVPSTPTLFLPRRDGFSEAVSSPQVPSSGFVFGSNPDIANPTQRSGLAQMAEGGLIDDTRIDLGQLDEGNRSQPTTPLHRSPTGTEGGVSTSEGRGAAREPPSVIITGAEQSNDEASQGSQDHFTEADSMAIAVEDGDEDDDEEELEDAEEEEEEGEEEEEEDQGDDDGDLEEHGEDQSQGELEERGSSDDSSQPSQEVSSIPGHRNRRITPITWNDHPQRGLNARRGAGRSPLAGRGGSRGVLNRERAAGAGAHGGRARRSRPGTFHRGVHN